MIEPFSEERLRGFLHRPERASGDAIALTHGAGSNCQAPLLIAVAEEFAAAGFTVLRFDLAFRQARPSGPPRPGDAALDRQEFAQPRRPCADLLLDGYSWAATPMAADKPPC